MNRDETSRDEPMSQDERDEQAETSRDEQDETSRD